MELLMFHLFDHEELALWYTTMPGQAPTVLSQ
jgi:hypothetical protein